MSCQLLCLLTVQALSARLKVDGVVLGEILARIGLIQGDVHLPQTIYQGSECFTGHHHVAIRLPWIEPHHFGNHISREGDTSLAVGR